MNIGNVILSDLSYCAIMGVAYILFYGLSSHLFTRIKVYYEIILGFLFGLLSLFAIMASAAIAKTDVEKGVLIYTPTLVLFMIGIFISFYTMMPALLINIIGIFVIPRFVPNIFLVVPNAQETISVVINYITIIGAALTIFMIKRNLSKPLSFLVLIIVCWLEMSIVILSYNKGSHQLIHVCLAAWFGFGYILFLISFLTDNIHNHAIRLREIIENDNEFFVASVGVREKFLAKVQRENITRGFVISFFITRYDLLDKAVSPLVIDFIWKNVTKEIHDKLIEINKDAYFFHINYKVNGIFIPLTKFESDDLKTSYEGNTKKLRSEEDELKKYEALFNGITQSFNIQNYRISIKIRATCAVYGVQSSNFERIVEDNNFYVANREKLADKNIVYLINPADLADSHMEMRKLKSLSSIVQINNSSVLYEPIYDLKSRGIDSYFLNSIVDGNVVFPLEDNSSQMTIIEEFGLQSMFYRYLALKALKDTGRNKEKLLDRKVYVFYDSKFFSSPNFSVTEFITKIKKTKMRKENIVLTFNAKGEIEQPEILKENIKILLELGLTTAMYNFLPTQEIYSLVPFYQPSDIILSNELTSGISVSREHQEIIGNIIKMGLKIEARVIAYKIKSFLIYKTLKNLGIDAVFGDLIGSSTQIKESLQNEQLILLNK